MKQFITLTLVVLIISILVVSSPKAYFTNVPFQPGQEVEIIHYNTLTTTPKDLTSTTGTLKGITEDGLIILETNGKLMSFDANDVVGLNGTVQPVVVEAVPVDVVAEKDEIIAEKDKIIEELMELSKNLKQNLSDAIAKLEARPVKNDPKATRAKCKAALKKYRDSGTIPQMSKDSPPEPDSGCFIHCLEN